MSVFTIDCFYNSPIFSYSYEIWLLPSKEFPISSIYDDDVIRLFNCFTIFIQYFSPLSVFELYISFIIVV